MSEGRKIGRAVPDDDRLGPLRCLPGTWSNKAEAAGIDFNGFGWNLIALPFEAGPSNYRVLMNQYNENLVFKTADTGVPNRGLDGSGTMTQGDQTLIALDYEQTIEQIARDDSPPSSEEVRAAVPKGIHHEPGLFLHVIDERTAGLDIARLATIPHGDSVLAMGRLSESLGAPNFPGLSALPVGLPSGLTFDTPAPPPPAPDYLAPYRHFNDNPFKGTVTAAGFPGFVPSDIVNLLRINPVVDLVEKSIVYDFDTRNAAGGIVNIPFIVAQANATAMRSIFWLHQLKEKENGAPIRVLQYLQIVMLEFFPRADGENGLIKWPHVSINTMKWIAPEPVPYQQMLAV